MIIGNLNKNILKQKIFKRGEKVVNKNMFNKVICFVIALMMFMPALPGNLAMASDGISWPNPGAINLTKEAEPVTETENQWEIEPRDLDPLGNKTMVTVSANIEGKVQKMGEMPFRVKRIPDPIATVDNMTGGTINRERLRIQRLVSAQLVDFDFDMAFDVTGFDLTVATSGGMTQTLQSNNMYFTAEMQQMLNTLSAGGKLTIENIKARKRDDPKDPERILSPIILTVR